jgi:osmotically-inducible protein OsmY
MVQQQTSNAVPAARLGENQILSAVERRLRRSTYSPIRNLHCEFHDGVLTLRGRLSSYFLKQVAQSLVVHMEGVEKVQNRVEVAYPNHRPDVASSTNNVRQTPQH